VRTTRFLLTLASREAYTILTLGVGLVATPLLLRWLGDERFGAFRVATDWLGYIGLLELGLGGALLPLLARAEGSGNHSAARALIVTSIRAYALVGVAMAAGTLLLAAAINWLVPVASIYSTDLRASILVGFFGLVLIPLSPFRALAEARQQGYWVSLFLTVQSLVITAGSLVLAWAGLGITGQAIAMVAGAAVFNLALLLIGGREIPGIARAVIRDPSSQEARRELRRLNMPTFVMQVCGRLSYLTDNIIVARMISPSIVVTFFLTQRLASLGQGELQGIGNASWAGLAELHVQGQTDVFNRRLVELTRYVAVLGFAVLIPIASYNLAFVSLWIGSQRYGGDLLTILAACNAMLAALLSLWGWCINGTGGAPLLMKALVVQTIINVACSVGFTFAFGMVGPLLGTTVAFLAVSAWFIPRLMTVMFGTSSIQLATAVGVPALLAIPCGALTWWVSRAYGPSGWFGIAYHMAAAATIYLALSWLLVLDRGERSDLMARFRTVLRADAAA
jgi:O-antigen/teichoic acid export membrane protein